MKHRHMSRPSLAALSIACFLACSGKLNTGQGTEEPGAGTGSGGTLGGSAAGGHAGALGGSSGSGGSGGSGGSPGKHPITKLGNPEACPAASPTLGDSCELEGVACGYGPPPGSTDISYTQCLCGERAAGDLRWDCTGVGSSSASCPTSVENGSSCFGHYSTECWYPVSIRCTCSPDPGVWECMKGSGRPWETPAPPTLPAAESPINALSDADREAWCRWFQDAASGPGFPPMSDSEVAPDGRTLNSSCTYGYGAACNVAVVTVSPRQCVQNLALSECGAPIGNLTDCVTTAFSDCVPSPHGCARYLAAGCSGTIVNHYEPQMAGGTGSLAGTGPTPVAGTAASFGGAAPSGEFSSPCSLQVE